MAELARLERERDERVRRVLAQAEQRKARREQALRRIVQTRPAAPQGLATTLRRKAHQQALLAWEAAKEAATQLVEEARRLAARLLAAVQPERLAAWARDPLQRGQREQREQRVADRALAAPAKALPLPQPAPPQPSRKPQLPDASRYSIEEQYRLYNHIVDELKAHRQGRVQRVAAKVAKRLERRETLARWSEADRPQQPQGLLAAFKKGQYDQAVKVYEKGQRRDRRLVEQADELSKKVLKAAHRSENWAAQKLHDLQPEFVSRVERYVRGYNQGVQIAELEAKQKLQRDRGIEGPQRIR